MTDAKMSASQILPYTIYTEIITANCGASYSLLQNLSATLP